MFVWKCAHKKLPTKAIIFRHLNSFEQACPWCGNKGTPLHVLRDCFFSRTFWLNLGINNLPHNFFITPFQHWCKSNMLISVTVLNIPWKILFDFCIWSLWLAWNSLIFHNKETPYTILQHAATNHALEFFFLSNIPNHIPPQKNWKPVSWSPGPHPFITLNTDWSSIRATSLIGAGSLARDHNGKWILCYSLHLRKFISLMAELWAIRHGLDLLWFKGYRYVYLQSNSKLDLTWITGCN